MFNRLIAQGYQVYYAITRKGHEIDFIAIKKGENLEDIKKYIQVSYYMTDESVVERGGR